jgi:tetratricopeptide (TPR) repeat protein
MAACGLAVLIGPSRADDRPAIAKADTDLEIGSAVIDTDPDMPLLDGSRQVSARGEIVFTVKRWANGYVEVATEDNAVRGWLEIDRVLPLDKATARLTDRLAANPSDARAYQARGRIWIENEDWERALADLDAAVRLAPADARSHQLRGLVHFQKKQFDAAIKNLTEAIRLDPQFATAYRDRGLVWDAQRFFDKALADLNEAVRLDPGNHALVMSRAKICATRGRHNEAMADYAWVLQRRPTDAAVYMARGEALLLNLESMAAVAEFTKALEMDPAATKALVLRAGAWNRHFQYGRAIDDYAKAIRRAGDDPAPRRALAWLLATCLEPAHRDGPRAVREATMACELTHYKSAECLDALAASCAEAGEFAAAVKWQAEAIKLVPRNDKKALRPYIARRALYERKRPYRD